METKSNSNTKSIYSSGADAFCDYGGYYLSRTIEIINSSGISTPVFETGNQPVPILKEQIMKGNDIPKDCTVWNRTEIRTSESLYYYLVGWILLLT